MYYMVCMSDDLKIGVVICLWLIRIYNELKLMFYMRFWNDELEKKGKRNEFEIFWYFLI